VTARSPAPWKIVPYHIPYYTWIMAKDGSCVCLGFGERDADALVNAWRRRVTIWDWLVAGLFGGLAAGAFYVTFTKGEDVDE
jgi:hypothetical protein